jgi:hypothetical protein
MLIKQDIDRRIFVLCAFHVIVFFSNLTRKARVTRRASLTPVLNYLLIRLNFIYNNYFKLLYAGQ